MIVSVKEWLLRLSSYVITFSYLSIPIVSIYHPPETLHYIHLFIQLDSFTICTLVYIIITTLFLHLHFTITFRQTTNSACAHQLRLAPQYDMHITSIIIAMVIALLLRSKRIMFFAIHVHNWGEPERAPHRLVERSRSIYYILYISYLALYPRQLPWYKSDNSL